jgi:tetratricopeptide (TPR) repeat protein
MQPAFSTPHALGLSQPGPRSRWGRRWRIGLASLLFPVYLQPFTAGAQTPPANAGAAREAATASQLTAELMFEILLGELNAQQGEPGVGYSLLLDAARRTGDARLYQRAVDIALQSRSGDAALEAANAWRQALPQSREANRHVLQILLALNRVSDTLLPLRQEINLTPPDQRVAALTAIPALYARVSNKKMAAQVVEQALAPYQARSDTGPIAWAVVGHLRLQAGDLEASLQAAHRSLALNDTSPAPVWLALELMSQRHPGAEAFVGAALEKQNAPELRLGLARVLIEQLRLDEASQQLTRLTKDQPGFAPSWLLLGSVLSEKGEADAARAAWMRYLDSVNVRDPKLQRELAQVYLGLAQIATRRGDDAGAESWLSRIDDPRSLARVQIQRASILARQGKLPQARQIIEELPARNPQERRTKLLAEVQLLRDNQALPQAYERLTQALASEPDDTELQYEQAMVAEKMERLDEMERLLRAIIQRQPTHYQALNALGYSLADRGVQLPEARELIVRALQQVPDDPFVTDSLGWVEFRLGRHQEALTLLQQAYRARADAEIAAHLGEVLWAMGQRDQALQVWREGLRADADNATLRNTLKRLKVPL